MPTSVSRAWAQAIGYAAVGSLVAFQVVDHRHSRRRPPAAAGDACAKGAAGGACAFTWKDHAVNGACGGRTRRHPGLLTRLPTRGDGAPRLYATPGRA